MPYQPLWGLGIRNSWLKSFGLRNLGSKILGLECPVTNIAVYIVKCDYNESCVPSPNVQIFGKDLG